MSKKEWVGRGNLNLKEYFQNWWFSDIEEQALYDFQEKMAEELENVREKMGIEFEKAVKNYLKETLSNASYYMFDGTVNIVCPTTGDEIATISKREEDQ